MNNGKVKNIIIIILLTVNLFLAAIVVINSAEERQYEEAARSSLREAVENSGISLSDPAILSLKPIPECRAARSISGETKLVSGLLGSGDRSDQGGNIVMYYGKNGQACYRGTGDFEILMENNFIKTDSNPIKAARSALKKIGIDPVDATMAQTDMSSGGSTVTATCAYKDLPVVNCRVTLTFSAENLLLVTGTRILDNVSPNNNTEVIDVNTAVMRFLQMLKESGYACREITDLSHCYKMDVAASGDATLTPLWHFETDIGDFYINGITGKTETVTQSN